MAGDELKVPSQRNDDARDGSDHDLTDRYPVGKVPTDTDPLDTPATDRDPADRPRNDRTPNDRARSGLGRNDRNVNDTGRNTTERSDAERLDAERSDTLETEARRAEAREGDVLHADARKGDAQRADARRTDLPGDDRAGTDTGAGAAPAPSPATPGAGADHEPVFRDGPYANVGRPEQARPGETVAAHAAPGEVVLFERDPAEVQARWRDLQASFVDDPGDAVQRADGLVGEVVESLTSTLNSRTAALRDRWKSAGDSGTEEMRQALREYRDVLERLLALSGSSPSQSSPAVPAASRRSGNEVS